MFVLILVVVLAVGLTVGLKAWAQNFRALTVFVYWLNARFFPGWWAANREKIARRNPGLRLPP